LPGTFGFSPLSLCIGLVLLAALADLLDGWVARALHAESAFGCLFDSLADAIAFGVTPATVVLASLRLDINSPWVPPALAASMLFAICGVLRLVRFNVQKAAEETEAAKQQGMRHFTGLPIPAAALSLLSLEYFWQSSFLELLDPQLTSSPAAHAGVVGGAELLLGYLMVSRLKFPSAKLLHVRVRTFTLAMVSVAGSLSVLYGLLHSFELLALFLTWGYILLALGLGIARQIAGRRSATLQEFEPEEEEEI
jgi:CDP-diacylglycerol--serine O-phosphatidyltransferase